MCGIVGVLGSSSRRVLAPMMDALTHRGPDGQGAWHGQDIGLGMRRLSIVDIETGDQPFTSNDNEIISVFNGEIYNHRELRQKLVASGSQFVSDHADGEVIPHLYQRHGASFASMLDGMFAIAVWDAPAETLILVRDRAGIKPLYYAETEAGLVFGSEPKALLCHPDVSRAPDLAALHHYFSYKNIPAPASAFKQIRQLPPGHLLKWSRARLHIEAWWRLDGAAQSDMNENEAADHIRALLTNSVKNQMVADVPVGTYLSGGLDSSAVATLMAQHSSGPIDTFTLAYADQFANKEADRVYARKISERIGSRHHEAVISEADLISGLDDIVTAFDEPFSGVMSTHFLTRLISKHVKVALSGDGADELFGSYFPHRTAWPLQILRDNGCVITGLSGDALAVLGDYKDEPDVLAKLLAAGGETEARMQQYLCDDFSKREIYSPMMRAATENVSTADIVAQILSNSGSDDPLNRILYLDFHTLLSDQVLPFVDRLSMAHSVEVRPPFLDHQLIEFAASLPGRFKIKNGRVKHILKEALRPLLPKDLIDRPKEGFVMPVNDWLKGRLWSILQDALSPANLNAHGLFDPDKVTDMINDHSTGHGNHANRLWNLFMFQLWWDRYQTR